MPQARVIVALATLLFVVGAHRADAETINLSFGFVASGFGGDAPVDPVTGVVSVTFDNSSNLVEQTAGITISNLNIALDSGPAFGYGAAADVLIIGGIANGAQTLGADTNDILFGIYNASTSPRAVGDFVYSQRSRFAVYKGVVTLTPAPVPEPATFSLFGLGAAVAVAQRRRRGTRLARRPV